LACQEIDVINAFFAMQSAKGDHQRKETAKRFLCNAKRQRRLPKERNREALSKGKKATG
jgi:hypothetical protein